jgi:hypothetical protein
MPDFSVTVTRAFMDKRSSVACRTEGVAMAATMRTPRAPLNPYRKSVSR